MEPFAGVPLPSIKPFIRIHDLDFYLMEGNRIKINWCIIDVISLFEQVGYKIMPPAPMPSGGYRAPNAMDGFPAPLSETVNAADTMLSNRMVWYGPGGVGTAYSKKDYRTHFLEPLHGACSNIP